MRGIDLLLAVVVLVGTYLSSYFTGGKFPYYISYTCLGLFVMDLIWARAGVNVTAENWIETVSAQVGDSVRVYTEIKNNSRWPVPWVQCWTEMPGTFGLPDDLCCYTISLKPHESRVVSEEFRCELRGNFEWGECTVKTGGFLGIFTNIRGSSSSKKLEVMPKYYDLRRSFITKYLTGKLRLFNQPASRNTGFFGIRNHVSSDGISQVHWKVSARLQHLVVKESQQVTVDKLILVLDTCIQHHAGSGLENSFEEAVSLASSLAYTATKTGNDIKFMLYQNNLQKDVLDLDNTDSNISGSGKSQFPQILRCLTTVKLSDTPPTPAVSFVNQLSKQKGSLLLITGEVNDNLVKTLGRARASGCSCAVFLFKLENFGKNDVDIQSRENNVMRLGSYGIEVIQLNKAMDFRTAGEGCK